MMNQFLEEAGEELGLSTAFMMSLNLVMEEAVSNIIFYAYKGDVEDAVDISLVREGGELIVTLIDHGIAFDPTLRKDPDITLSAEDQMCIRDRDIPEPMSGCVSIEHDWLVNGCLDRHFLRTLHS